MTGSALQEHQIGLVGAAVAGGDAGEDLNALASGIGVIQGRVESEGGEGQTRQVFG